MWTKVMKSEEVQIEACCLVTDSSWSLDKTGEKTYGAILKTFYNHFANSGIRSDVSEVDRIFVDSERITPQGTVSHDCRTQSASDSRFYVPVILRFSLLSYYRGLELSKTDSTSQNILRHEDKQPIICNESSLPRLLISTVWLSHSSTSEVWSCVSKEETIDNCVFYECNRRLKMSRDLYAHGNLVDAYEQLALSGLIGSPKYAISPHDMPFTLSSYIRMKHSLAGKLDKVIKCMEMLIWMLSESSSESSTTLNLAGLANTLMRHVALPLRLIILNDQEVHLRSGCLLILQKLEDLEKYLCLPRIAISAVDTSMFDIEKNSNLFTAEVEIKFRRALGLNGKFLANIPVMNLRELCDYAKCILYGLQSDIHQNIPLCVRDMLAKNYRVFNDGSEHAYDDLNDIGENEKETSNK
jgi:hypothetical protein